MKVHEIIAEAANPKGTAFEIFVRMLPSEVTKATLKEVDAALRWLARTAKTSPSVTEDIAASLVAGSKHLGISIREMAQIAQPQLLKAGIDPMDVHRALDLAEKLAEPSMWQKFVNAIGAGAKKEPKPGKPEATPTPTPPGPTPTPTPPGPTPTPPGPTPTPPGPTPTPPGPGTPGRIAAAEAGSVLKKYNPAHWNWWQRADAIAMAYGIIEPWYTFKQRSDKAIEEFASKAKNPDGSLMWQDKETLSKGVQIAAQEAIAQTGALLAGRKLIGLFGGTNTMRGLPNKTQEEINAMWSKMGPKAQLAFAAWLDSPQGRKAFDGWLWGQLYSQESATDEYPALAISVNSVQGQIAWALRQVSGYMGGLVKSFYDGARRSAGQIDSQGNDTAAATQKQQAAKDALPNSGGVLNTTTER